MPWMSRTEYDRLLNELAARDSRIVELEQRPTVREMARMLRNLKLAEDRAVLAEEKREKERKAAWQLNLNVMDRWHTSEKKTFAVSMGAEEGLVPEIVETPPDPFADWTPEQREFDIKCFEEVGDPHPEESAKAAYLRNYVEQPN